MNRYHMRNYGPADYSWELWHEGPVRDRENVVLIHGYRLPFSAMPGRCDEQFGCLDRLLEATGSYNVWQFEYVGSLLGTYDSIAVYASRLGAALNKIAELSGKSRVSIIGYSMGGLIARYYIARGGKSRVDKMLTLATPHMGTLRFEPFSIPRMEYWYPRAVTEIRPDGRLLWDLNTRVDESSVPEFATIGGYSWGNSDGTVEMASTSLVKCGSDGSISNAFYFAGVPRSHLNINRITSEADEVFQLIHSFLTGGVLGISKVRCPEKPGDYRVPFFLTFSIRWGRKKVENSYPCVIVNNTGNCYRRSRIFTQGARTEDGGQIYTVQMRPEEDGEARIYWSPNEYTNVRVHSGQSSFVAKQINAMSADCTATTPAL